MKEKRNKGYYTAARRYEFYFQVLKTIFYEGTLRVSKILFCLLLFIIPLGSKH